MEERRKQRLLDEAQMSVTHGGEDLQNLVSGMYTPPEAQAKQPAKSARKSKPVAPGGKATQAMTAKKVEPPAPKERIEVPDEGWRAEQMLYDLRSRVGRDVRDKDPATMDLERRLKEKAGLK
jgi:hypothetical protein